MTVNEFNKQYQLTAEPISISFPLNDWIFEGIIVYHKEQFIHSPSYIFSNSFAKFKNPEMTNWIA